MNMLKLFYEKTIQPVFDYAFSVWSHTKQGNIFKLHRAKNYVASIVIANLHSLISGMLFYYMSLIWYQLKKMWLLCYISKNVQTLNGLTPPYLTDSIVMASVAHDSNTRLTNQFDIQVLFHNNEILKRSLYK